MSHDTACGVVHLITERVRVIGGAYFGLKFILLAGKLRLLREAADPSLLAKCVMRGYFLVAIPVVQSTMEFAAVIPAA
jgi:hypothetical protein